jgi:NTE family protein
MVKEIRFIVWLLFISYNLPLSSQNYEPSIERKRPKVGLVLSGGGAKGFSYIGLLKVLEEVNMPIDYIGGSSMGAITAALYSVGYSPETITEIIRGQDWESFISDKQNRKYVSYEEKLFSDKYIFSMPFEEDKIFSLSKSLNSSFNIDLMLNNLLYPAAHIKDFKDLPIPFLCIGTDLLTGEAVVLTDGNLARAVRATMAIPGYFSPVEYYNTYLVDGGVVNNYPAEQVKAMGADIIIGGDVQSGLKNNIEEFESIATVLDQVISFNRKDANLKGIELTDYYVKIDMPYGMFDFDKYDSIIAIGEKVAREHYNDLKALADSLNSIESYENKLVDVRPFKSFSIDSVIWEGLNVKQKDRYYDIFENLSEGEASFAELEDKMKLLNGSKIFDDLRYEFQVNNRDSLNLEIKAEKTNKGNFAAGVHYDNVYNGGVLLNLTLRNIKGGRSKLFTDIVLSENPRLNAMFILNNGFRPGFGMEANFFAFDFSQYENGERINTWDFDNYSLSTFMPVTIKNNYLFKLGFQYELFRFRQKVVVDPELEAYNKFADYGNLFVSFNHDSRDKVYFTTRGQFIEFKFKHVFPFSDQWSDVLSNASIMYLKYNSFIGLSEKWILKPGLFVGYTFSDNLDPVPYVENGFDTQIPAVQHLFAYGGLNPVNYIENHIPFTGLKFIEKFGLYAGKISMNLQYNFYPKLYATLMADFGINEMRLNQIDDIDPLLGYGVRFSYHSFVGPIEIAAMSSNIDRSINTFLNIGFWF